jgi:hypothetical protein
MATNVNTKFWVMDGDTATAGPIKVKVEARPSPSWTTFRTWYDVSFRRVLVKEEYTIIAGFVSRADAAGYLVGRLGVSPTDAQRVME